MSMNTSQKDTIPEFERTVECVFCIDCSADMAPRMDAVRGVVKTLISESLKGWIRNDVVVGGYRAKIIAFRNYETDGADAMSQSRWFDLFSDDVKEFDACLNSLQASGGADANNGLEALFYAMTTDWGGCGDKDRQIIVLLSNTDVVPLGAHAHLPHYPAHMVDGDGLLCTWMCYRPDFLDKEHFKLKERRKRMCLYGLAGSAYERMAADYNRCQFIPVSGDSGFSDEDVKDVFRVIAVGGAAAL